MGRHGRWRRAASSIEDGFFGRIFTSYDRLCDAWRGGAVYGAFASARTSRFVSRVRRGVSRSVEGSLILRAIGRLFSSLPRLALRVYGVFFLSFGLYTSVIFAIKAVATTLTAEVDSLVVGAMMAVLSLPLLLSRKTLAEAVTSSSAMSYLAFDILGFRREDASAQTPAVRRLDTPFLAGMIAGLLTFYFKPGTVVMLLLAATAICIAASKPETGLMMLFALFPFFSDAQLTVFILIITVSYLIKFICGRRTMRFDLADSMMLMFFFLTLFAGIVHYGIGAGMHGNFRRVVFLMPYFLTANLMTNKAWRSRLIKTLMFGGSALAIVSLAPFLGDKLTSLDVVGSDVLAGVLDWCGSVIRCAGASSYYLAMMLPVMTAYSVSRGIGGKRLNVMFFAVVILTAAALTMSRGLWLGAVAGALLFLAACDIRFLILPAAAAVGIPAAMILLPDAARAELTSLLDMSGAAGIRRIAERRMSGKIFVDNFIGGIGSADGVFSAVYDSYTPVGASADNAQNLFLGIGVELGAAGLFVFLFAITLILIKSFTCSRRPDAADSGRMSLALAAGLFAAIVSGMSSYIWIDDRMFLLFFMFAGASSAYNDTGVKSEPKRMAANGHGITASVDLPIRRR